MAQLAPVQRPIGVFPNFIAKGTEALVIKERVFSLSGDSFDITDAQGRAVFKVEAHHISLSGRKSLSDSAGNKLFDLVKEHLHIHTTFVGEDTQKKKILEVKNSFKCMLLLPPFGQLWTTPPWRATRTRTGFEADCDSSDGQQGQRRDLYP